MESKHLRSKKNVVWIVIAVIMLIVCVRMIMHFSSNPKEKMPTTTVATASVKTNNVPIYFSALGTVDPETVITVRTQISGILTHVYFKDGQMVKAGDVLAEIDSRPYQAQLLQSQGQLLRDNALLHNAKIDLKRYQNLYQSRSVSEQTLNTQQSLVKQYEGTVKIDQGQIDAAKTNIDYCKITSPTSGRIGIGIVDEGNYVQTADVNGIAVITSLDPIDVLFSLPEEDVTIIEKNFHTDNKLTVDVYDRDQNTLLASGNLVAIDNQVNVSTGTVNFKAKFKNETDALFPNQFVNVKLLVTTLQNALVIPTAAVQQSTEGPYVYRYNTNKTVSRVDIKTGPVSGNNTVVTSGLTVNQIIVISGTDKLFDGAPVLIAGKIA